MGRDTRREPALRGAARLMWVAALWVALAAGACDTSVNPVDEPDAQPDAEVCGPFHDPLAMPGDPIEETWENTAVPFFETYCTACHDSTLMGSTERRGAPPGLDWDVEESARDYLALIRDSIGVNMNMPPGAAMVDCDDLRAILRWIDADAP